MLSANEGLALSSSGILLYWDGQQWNEKGDPLPDCPQEAPSRYFIADMDAISLGEAWVVRGEDISNQGCVLRWDGSSWQVIHTTGDLYSITARTANDVWIIERNLLAHWDGESWTDLPGLPSIFNTVELDVVSADNIWSRSHAAIYHWDGESWAEESRPRHIQISFIMMISDTTGVAVSGSGSILQRMASRRFLPYLRRHK